MGRSVGEPKIIEFGNEPEYFVKKIRIENDGGGNVRVYAYKVSHGNEWHLLYTAIIPETELTEMGRQCLAASDDTPDDLPPRRSGKFTN